jgi:hypothetical protein
VPNLQITAAGRKRVASDDFAKCLVHVVGQASNYPDPEVGSHMVALYVALNLAVDETNFVAIPAAAPTDEAEAKEVTDFMNANDKEIRATIQRVLTSPAYIVHAMQCFGTDGLDEYLAQFPQA